MVLIFHSVKSTSYENISLLHSDLLTNHSKDIRPELDLGLVDPPNFLPEQMVSIFCQQECMYELLYYIYLEMLHFANGVALF
jgi:hypothetical protein